MKADLMFSATYFFGKMIEKFKYKLSQGYTGWSSTRPSDKRLIESMQRNIEKKDWVDVANLAMILDYRKNNKSLARNK